MYFDKPVKLSWRQKVMSDIAQLTADVNALTQKSAALETAFASVKTELTNLKNSTTTTFSPEDQAALDAAVTAIESVNTGIDAATAAA